MQEDMQMRTELTEAYQILTELDPVSFLLVKNTAEILLAREQLEKQKMAGEYQHRGVIRVIQEGDERE